MVLDMNDKLIDVKLYGFENHKILKRYHVYLNEIQKEEQPLEKEIPPVNEIEELEQELAKIEQELKEIRSKRKNEN